MQLAAPRPCPRLSPDQQALVEALKERVRQGLLTFIQVLEAKDEESLKEVASKEAAGFGAAGALAAAVNIIPGWGQIVSAIIALGIAIAKALLAIGKAQVAGGASFSAAKRVQRYPAYRGFTALPSITLVAKLQTPYNEHPETLLAFRDAVNTTLQVYSELLQVDLFCHFPEWGEKHGYRSVPQTLTHFLEDGTFDQGPPEYLLEALLPEGWQEAAASAWVAPEGTPVAARQAESKATFGAWLRERLLSQPAAQPAPPPASSPPPALVSPAAEQAASPPAIPAAPARSLWDRLRASFGEPLLR